MEDKITEIDKRLTALENMHKFALLFLEAVGIYFITKNK